MKKNNFSNLHPLKHILQKAIILKEVAVCPDYAHTHTHTQKDMMDKPSCPSIVSKDV